MLKIRIVGCIIVRDGIVVQSIGFRKYLPVGRPEIAVEFLSHWGIDEICLLDINATPEKRRPNFELVERVSKYCRVPLTVGGGITRVDDIEMLLLSGAEKVAINKSIIDNSDLVKEGARNFGDQCIVASIDVRRHKHGAYEVFTCSGHEATGFDPVTLSRAMEDRGAGEILLNSIDRDGSKNGYELELIREVTEAVKIPVIACGGAGHPQHFFEALQIPGVMAVAAGNFFHFTEHSVTVAKRFLKKNHQNIRIDLYANYEGFDFDHIGRIAKMSDTYLEELRFKYYPDEVI